MKKIISLIALAALCLCLASCSLTQPGSPADNGGSPVQGGDSGTSPGTADDDRDPVTVTSEETDKGRKLTFSYMPSDTDELRAIDLSDEYAAACAILFALAEYEHDPEESLRMFAYVRGPEEVSAYDESFIKNQFDQYPYVIRSYFEGASPENGYSVDPDSPVTLTVSENPYSRDEDGYVKLFFRSSGADSERPVTLRYKASTDQWFLFSNTFMGLCAGITEPADSDWA